MIVIVLTGCPPSVKGDLTRWLFEINTNVFVGRITARVRDELWNRIVRSCGDGRAIMAYNAKNEQGFDFRTHNTGQEIVDLDGLKIVLKCKNLTDSIA